MKVDITGNESVVEYNKLKSDPVKMKKDIDKYGLFKYEDVSKYMRKEVFD